MTNATDWLNRMAADLDEAQTLQEANAALLVRKTLTDRFRRGVVEGQLTQERFNEKVISGDLLCQN